MRKMLRYIKETELCLLNLLSTEKKPSIQFSNIYIMYQI